MVGVGLIQLCARWLLCVKKTCKVDLHNCVCVWDISTRGLSYCVTFWFVSGPQTPLAYNKKGSITDRKFKADGDGNLFLNSVKIPDF